MVCGKKIMTPAKVRCMNMHGLPVAAISPSEIPDIIFLRIPGIARG
jgi:hypothetical protein